MDGPVGELIRQTAISHFRPAHVHFLLAADGYQPVVTQLFRDGTEFIETDVVFGVRPELVVPFVAHAAGIRMNDVGEPKSYWRVDYDFVLVKAEAAGGGTSST